MTSVSVIMRPAPNDVEHHEKKRDGEKAEEIFSGAHAASRLKGWGAPLSWRGAGALPDPAGMSTAGI